MDVRVGLWRRLSTEELMFLICGVGEDSWKSLGLQGDPTSPFWRRSALGFLWKNDAKAETPVLWPPHVKSWLIGKDSDAGRDWGQEEKGMTEDEMAGWHHWLDGRESEWTLGVGDGQGGLACCDSWGRKESDTTEWLNWTELCNTGFTGAQGWIICLPMQEKWVQSLDWEDPPREGNGNLLQYICLRNPMDREPWGAIVHGVTEELDMI